MAIAKIYDKATSTWFEVPIEDPTLYLLLDGTRAMTGALDMGGNAITNVDDVDGRDVSADGATLDTHIGVAVTAAAVIADHSILRGADGSRGAQDCGVLINDSDEMSGLTKLTLDNIEIDGNTVLNTFAGADLRLSATPSGPSGTVMVGKEGNIKANSDFFKLENEVWAADNDGTETSLLFRQATNAATGRDDSGRITVGLSEDWSVTGSTQSSYMAFHTALNGTVAERVRINPAGVVGINTTDPGGNISTTLLDIRRNQERCTMGMFTAHNTTASRGSSYYGGRSRGSVGSEAIVQDGDTLFAFVALGYDSAAWLAAAQIIFKVDGSPASGAVPTQIAFRTGPTNATIADRFTVQSDGDILVDGDSKMMFRDPDLYMQSLVDGTLRVVADTKLLLVSPSTSLTGTAVTRVGSNGINYNPGIDSDVDLVTVDVTGVPRQWWDESENAFAMTHRLILPEGVQTKYAVDDVADPPTDAELDTAFGDPTVVGSGFVGVLDDNDGGADCYICWTTGTAGEWFYIKGTKAA